MKFFLHRGLSFCDASFVAPTSPPSSKRWLYSKHKFKTQIENLLKEHASQITEIILLDEFADRLSGLRLGGSVAAVFPKGLEKLTQKTQSSPIHSESMIFVAPEVWSPLWTAETLGALQKDSIKRIAWQVEVPDAVLNAFAEAGFENFVFENLQPEMLLNWRRNLLNASCSGPVLELTEEIQSICDNLKIEAPIKWIDEDLYTKKDVKSRYGLTSVWTHLIAKWATKKTNSACDVFVLDWDGCFHIGPSHQQRWTPWGTISAHATLPNVKLLKIQPTTTLEKNIFANWSWLGKADSYEPGPVFLGRGLKPTVLDVLMNRENLQNQFEVKADFEERTQRLLSSLSGLKNSEQVQEFRKQISAMALKQWAQNMLELSTSKKWMVLGPIAPHMKAEFKDLPGVEILITENLPTLAELSLFIEGDA